MEYPIELTPTITFVNKKNEHLISNVKGAYVITNELDTYNTDNNYIISDNPRNTFFKLLDVLFPKPEIPDFGENVVIEGSVKIGNNVKIGHNTVIKKNTVIGDNVIIGCNNTIGGTGFGYFKDGDGEYRLINHYGGVKIGDNVEIGNNTCIDKGTIGDTIIGDNTKIDNLVHIAHNCKIGSNCTIIANCMLGGSVVMGDDNWIAPSSDILNGIKIGEKNMVGMSTTVIKDINNKELHVGVPNKKIKDL